VGARFEDHERHSYGGVGLLGRRVYFTVVSVV